MDVDANVNVNVDADVTVDAAQTTTEITGDYGTTMADAAVLSGLFFCFPSAVMEMAAVSVAATEMTITAAGLSCCSCSADAETMAWAANTK